MAWTQSDLDALDAAIAAGSVLQSFTFADQSFTFRSMAEMIQARTLIALSLAADSGSSSGYRLAATSKGA